MGDIIEVDERAETAGIVELMVGHGVGGEHDVPPGESAGVSLEQSTPQPSSFRMRRIAGFGRALMAKYSSKSSHHANACFSVRALRRIPASS